MKVSARFAATVSAVTAAAAQDLPEEKGLALITTYCSGCHAVGMAGDSPNPVAPKFRDLHLKYDVGDLEEALVEGIAAHPDMPEFAFGSEQAASIIAYLRSLEETHEAPPQNGGPED